MLKQFFKSSMDKMSSIWHEKLMWEIYKFFCEFHVTQSRNLVSSISKIRI